MILINISNSEKEFEYTITFGPESIIFLIWALHTEITALVHNETRTDGFNQVKLDKSCLVSFGLGSLFMRTVSIYDTLLIT